MSPLWASEMKQGGYGLDSFSKFISAMNLDLRFFSPSSHALSQIIQKNSVLGLEAPLCWTENLR